MRALVGVSVSDERVWELAIQHGCLFVSKDEGFHRLPGCSTGAAAPTKPLATRLAADGKGDQATAGEVKRIVEVRDKGVSSTTRPELRLPAGEVADAHTSARRHQHDALFSVRSCPRSRQQRLLGSPSVRRP